MSQGGSGPQFGERAEHGPNDVCYRHPGTPSFTLCQRCGRTICAQCQVVSAVGVLCPECVREAKPATKQRVGRSARATGRRVAASETPVTYGIMIICAVVFVLQWLSATFSDNGVTAALWYAPAYSLPPDMVPGALFGFEPWRMITAMFTHSTGFIFHILFNMYALWLFGRNLEQMLGRAWFLVLYLFAGLGGSLGVMIWGYFDVTSILVPTVGASGAIFGVLAATLVGYRAANVNITSLAVLIAINFGIGFLPGAAISWQAHLGGMIVGAAAMGLLVASRGPRRRQGRILGMVGLGVLLVVLSGLYFVISPLTF
ncbi:rhomboid family intramembrane serine protease [Leucobacter soli]|uniref:Rhomboid protease GlpG n=1 Tax=Leucobacter soli TaxID=2812850 RepID=A0A916JYY0_9MICO|nr:rhomboid family intramembrane serine protease [Leucobacter soli]CAG7607923.1 Rhomboid protease GlpG [Leucobacter soli]